VELKLIMPNVQAWYHTRMLQTHPKIIQGGMGAGVSSWTLANAVAKTGELGVVSGTALDLILPRRLQVGDPGGHMRRALANFPIPEMAKGILDRYFVEGGKQADEPFKAKPMLVMQPSERLEELLVVSNFVEVYLAKEGHDGVVGINYLEKIQLPNLPSMFGSMLAGVDYILMGAGIPVAIPGILDRLAEGRAVELAVDVKGPSGAERVMNHFDPQRYLESAGVTVERPHFLAIISTPTLATMLVRKADGVVDGFIIEGPTAGGHNAPPRGRLTLSEGGEPIYGSRDEPDLEAMCKIGRPFWLAGSYASPERVVDALADGAAGVQVGTAFAYCEESGLAPELRRQILEMSRQGTAHIFTDPVASPTGFPFKVVEMDGTISSKDVYEARNRVCVCVQWPDGEHRPAAGAQERLPGTADGHLRRRRRRSRALPARGPDGVRRRGRRRAPALAGASREHCDAELTRARLLPRRSCLRGCLHSLWFSSASIARGQLSYRAGSRSPPPSGACAAPGAGLRRR